MHIYLLFFQWADIDRGWIPERPQFGAYVASMSTSIHPARSSEIEVFDLFIASVNPTNATVSIIVLVPA